MARRKSRRQSGKAPDAFGQELLARMAAQGTADALNRNVIEPFVGALETVCAERGYVLNIYGERSNLVFSTEDHAEAIYSLVEQYLDANLDDKEDS